MSDQKGALRNVSNQLSTTRSLSAPGLALFFLGWGGVSPLFERKVDEKEAAHHFTAWFDNPTMPPKKTARMGDEGKAVGCVPPTALLFVALGQNARELFLIFTSDRD